MYEIGIIGKGFVGSAVAQGFSKSVGYDANIRIYDKETSRSSNSLEEVTNNSDVIFISIPTPAKKDGTMSLKMLKSCMKEIDESLKLSKNSPVLLIRSTVLPGTSRKFQEKYPSLKIVFNPEFLTERSANFDFISQTRFILGGEKENVKLVSDLYKDRFGNNISLIETDFETAELTKYVCNNYFATKVAFLNEMYRVAKKVNANWDNVIEGFLGDGRVGASHTNVPGPDGKYGFGGSCFPKDIQAMINFSKSLNLNPNVLEGAWKTNLEVRTSKDWEDLKGRAVDED